MLEPLFNPQTVAVIGASRRPDAFGHRLLAGLIEDGFPGTLVPVNPAASEVCGLPCQPRLAAFPGPVDLALVAVPAAVCKEAVREALDAGARAVAVLSVGFREAGEAGAEREREIAELCRQRDVRLLGPNCLGLINTSRRLFAFASPLRPKPGGISVFSQSSAICALLLERLTADHLGLAKMVSIGNKADLSESDLLRALAEDHETKVIVAYLESIGAGPGFVRAAERATARKPVIILRAATTLAGRKAVAAHSGEVIGQDSAYGAAFRRAGIIRAEDIRGLFNLAAAFSLQPLPRGGRVLILTNAGGPGIIAVDAVERAGLTAAYLDPQSATRLRQKLPGAATIYNPIDLLAGAGPEDYRAALGIALTDHNIDALVVICVGQGPESQALANAQALVAGQVGNKPILACFLGHEARAASDCLLTGGVPACGSPEEAVAALKAMWEYVSWRNRPPRVVTRFKVNRRRVERIISHHQRGQRPRINEAKAKDILRAYSFLVPAGRLAASAEEAVEIADRIGYPVALKLISPDLVRKGELDGVRLNIPNRQGVRDGFDLMMLRMARQAPKAAIDGIYVEKMLDRGLEVILGLHRDPQFGPLLMFGLGGINVEVMKDVAFNLAPITFDEAMTMLASTRSYQFLLERRGEAGVDVAALAGCLQRISQLATDFPQIAEVEINPLIIGELGGEPVVADAKITLGGEIIGQ